MSFVLAQHVPSGFTLTPMAMVTTGPEESLAKSINVLNGALKQYKGAHRINRASNKNDIDKSSSAACNEEWSTLPRDVTSNNTHPGLEIIEVEFVDRER